MAKQVIVLNRTVGDGILTTGVVWVAVPSAQWAMVQNPSATSQFVLATSAELAEIQLGHISEVPFQIDMDKSLTLAQQKTQFLLTASQVSVTYLSSQSVKLQYYGVFYDGTTWSA